MIEGTLDGRLIALDARTGTPCADFGTHGQVDITVGMGETPPGYISINSPPAIVRGVVVIGHQVLDGQKRYEPSGVIQGFDAVTGQLRWAWDMTHPEWNGAPPPGQTWTRGTPNMWTTAAADEQLGYVYLPMGNSTADYWSSSRTPPENRYATSLVALDVTTGKPVWNFQTTHIDAWDYDLGSQPSLIDFPKDGVNVPAVLLPSKQGELYVLDRRTGEPLVGVEERAVPGGGVEPQMRSKTQPFSLYHTLRKPDLTERDMWGMTPIDQLVCRIQFRKASYKGIYTPPEADRHSIEYPGYNGGSDWGSVAVDPHRGVIVANYNDMPNYNILVPRAKADKLGWAPRDQVRGDAGGAEGAGDPQAGTPYAVNVNAGWRLPFTKLLCKQPPYGGIRAIDLKSGKTLWDRPFGSARGNGPFGIRSGLPIEIGTPNNGGSVVTAGGLIFIAAATDDLIRAIDLATGKELWHAVAGRWPGQSDGLRVRRPRVSGDHGGRSPLHGNTGRRCPGGLRVAAAVSGNAVQWICESETRRLRRVSLARIPRNPSRLAARIVSPSAQFKARYEWPARLLCKKANVPHSAPHAPQALNPGTQFTALARLSCSSFTASCTSCASVALTIIERMASVASDSGMSLLRRWKVSRLL